MLAIAHGNTIVHHAAPPVMQALCVSTSMKVIDSENLAWFLFEHEGILYLDANCNMSAFGYSYMIELDEQEREGYQSVGRDYLNKLAYDIHYSCPIAKDTLSIYKGRDVSNELSDLATLAVKTWRESSSKK